MKWNVEVFGGVVPDADQLARAPIQFGPPEISIGDDGEHSEPTVPIIYGPVAVETMSPGSLSMWGNLEKHGGRRALHVMENVWHVLFSIGGLEVEGVEMRGDGVLVHSRWEMSPAPPSPEDEALIREVFGKL